MSKQKNNKSVKITTGADSSFGIKAILDKALQSYEKLPMLEIILEKFIRHLAIALRNLTSEPVDVEIVEFSSLRFGNYFKNIKFASSIGVFKAMEWGNLGLIVLNNELVFSFVDLLLGGKKSFSVTTSKGSNERVLTSIEQGIAKQIIEVLLTELSNAFEQVSPVNFSFERLENNPNFATICRPGDAIMVLKAKVEIDSRSSTLELLIPYKTIEPVKSQMQQVFFGDTFGTDAIWQSMVSNVLHQVDLPIEAVIINKPMLLKEIVNLKVGDTIVIDHHKDEDVLVRSGNVDLFKAQVGNVDGNISVSLKANLVSDYSEI